MSETPVEETEPAKNYTALLMEDLIYGSGLNKVEEPSQLSTGTTVLIHRRRGTGFSVTTLVSSTGRDIDRLRSVWIDEKGEQIYIDLRSEDVYILDGKDVVNAIPGTVINATVLKNRALPEPARLMFITGDEDTQGGWIATKPVYTGANLNLGDTFTSEEVGEWEVVLEP